MITISGACVAIVGDEASCTSSDVTWTTGPESRQGVEARADFRRAGWTRPRILHSLNELAILTDLCPAHS